MHSEVKAYKNVLFTVETLQRVREMARKKGLSDNALIEMLMREALDRELARMAEVAKLPS